MSTQLEEGKVYLRDTRNGNVHPYEALLAEMQYMKPFIAGSEEEAASAEPTFNISLTGIDRAAEWDRLAGMSKEARDAELNGKPAPWERHDYLSASDTVPRPADAPELRKQKNTTATQAAVAAPAAPPKPPVPASPVTESEAPQTTVETPPAPPVRKAYKLTDKANGASFDELKANGWTKETLLAEGLLVEVEVPAA